MSSRKVKEKYIPPCGIYHMKIGPRGVRQCWPGYVYVARYGEIVKIGSTTRIPYIEAVRNRLRALRRKTGVEFEFLFALNTHCAKGLEKFIHDHFRDVQVDTELFYLSDADLTWIYQIRSFVQRPVNKLTEL